VGCRGDPGSSTGRERRSTDDAATCYRRAADAHRSPDVAARRGRRLRGGRRRPRLAGHRAGRALARAGRGLRALGHVAPRRHRRSARAGTRRDPRRQPPQHPAVALPGGCEPGDAAGRPRAEPGRLRSLPARDARRPRVRAREHGARGPRDRLRGGGDARGGPARRSRVAAIADPGGHARPDPGPPAPRRALRRDRAAPYRPGRLRRGPAGAVRGARGHV